MSYRSNTQTERKPARLVTYRGPRALVSYHDGQTYTMPSQPLRKLGLKPADRFFVVVVWEGGRIREVRAERQPAARPMTRRPVVPKIMVRDGRRVQTRR